MHRFALLADDLRHGVQLVGVTDGPVGDGRPPVVAPTGRVGLRRLLLYRMPPVVDGAQVTPGSRVRRDVVHVQLNLVGAGIR